jgi:hypothetical protein
MPSRKRARSARVRMGRVSLYPHHGAWWIYYRDGGAPVRRKVAQTRPEAEQVAAQGHAQLTSGAPTLLAFAPIGVPELCLQFLDYHEQQFCYAASGGQRRSPDPANHPWAPADQRQWPGHDRALHPHAARDPARADRAGPAALV